MRATLDPFQEGDDAEGLVVRFGYIVSAFGYAVLLIATVQYFLGFAVSGNGPQDWSAKLMSQPWGRFLVGAIWSGRFGLAARGVVFALIGLFLVQAAFFVSPCRAQGLDGALLAIASSPYGPYLLIVVALGLIAFGIYSILCARWMRVPTPRSA